MGTRRAPCLCHQFVSPMATRHVSRGSAPRPSAQATQVRCHAVVHKCVGTSQEVSGQIPLRRHCPGRWHSTKGSAVRTSRWLRATSILPALRHVSSHLFFAVLGGLYSGFAPRLAWLRARPAWLRATSRFSTHSSPWIVWPLDSFYHCTAAFYSSRCSLSRKLGGLHKAYGPAEASGPPATYTAVRTGWLIFLASRHVSLGFAPVPLGFAPRLASVRCSLSLSSTHWGVYKKHTVQRRPQVRQQLIYIRLRSSGGLRSASKVHSCSC